MASRRVSWEVLVSGSETHLYFDKKKQALDYARDAKALGHKVAMNRWELVGDDVSWQPVDLDALIASEALRKARQAVHTEPVLKELPPAVWAEVIRALAF